MRVLSDPLAGAAAMAGTYRTMILDRIDCPQFDSLNNRGWMFSDGEDILSLELRLGCHSAAASVGGTL